MRLSRSGGGGWLRRRSRLGFRRFDTPRRRSLGPRDLDGLRGRRRGRRRRKLDRSRRRRGLGQRKRRLRLGRQGLFRDRRWRCFRRGRQGLLFHGRRRLFGDRRRRRLRRGKRRLLCWRRLLGDRRGNRRWRRRLGRGWRGVLSGRRRGLFGRLRLLCRCRRVFGGRFRLNVDDHFPRGLKRPRLQRDEEERGGVKRDHDQDDEWAEPWRTDGRRLEDAPVERRGSHGAGAFGAAEAGAFGAAGAGETARRGPDTIAIREIPFAASSSITDTTSP